MKRIWHTWLAVVATASIATSASAQHDWNQPSDIGSYQSIMSRAGINQGNHDRGASQAGMQPRNGIPVAGQPLHGQPIVNPQTAPGYSAAPAYGAPINGAPLQANCGTNAGCSTNGHSTNGQASYFDGGCGDSGACTATGGGGGANWVIGTRALFFTRSGESPIALSREGQTLWSTDNDYGTMPGGEVSLIRRSCSNRGLEFRYWGLYPSQRDYTLAGPGLDTYLTGFNSFVIAPGAVNVLDYYNNAANHRIYRNNEIHSAEVNGLRNGGSYSAFGGRTGNYELLGGFRWFQFNEDYRFAAFNGAVNPMQVNYDLATRNTLLGFQLGGRNELCLTDRLSLLGGTRVGLFNNNSRSRQSITNEFGQFAYLDGGVAGVDDFNYSATRNSLAMLGELDLGIACRLTQKVRATVGYRLIGVSGVALAPNQIPRNFLNVGEMNRVKSDDSLILGGGYGGLEMCF